MNPSAVLRSERLRPLTRLAAAWGVWAALGLGVASHASAESGGGPITPAGTIIENRATATYSTQNGEAAATASTVSFTVGQVAGADVEPPRVSISAPGSEVVFPHTLINVGNGPDSYGVGAVASMGSQVRIFHDVDDDGLLTTVDTLLTGRVALPMGGSFPLLVVVTVTAGMSPGDVELIDVTGTSLFDGSVADVVTDEVRFADAGVNPLVEKLVDRTQAAPGDLLTYSLRIRLDGAGQRDSVFLTDKIPSFATYEPGTLQLEGQNLTDAVDADAGSYQPAAGMLLIDLTNLSTGVDAHVLFQVRIDPDTPIGTQITNRAKVAVHTPLGQLEEESLPASTQVAAPAIGITKSVSGLDPATAGDSLIYTIVVSNPSATLAAVDLTVVDTLPESLILVGATPAASVVDRELTWTIARLEPGQSAELVVTTEVPEVTGAEAVVNRAHLSHAGGADASAESAARTLVPSIDASLSLTLEAEVVEVQMGEILPLQASVTNDGDVTVTDVTVDLRLPRGTLLVDDGPLPGTFSGLRPSPSFLESSGGPAPVSGGTQAWTGAPLELDTHIVVGGSLQVRIPGELRPQETVRFRYLLVVNSAREEGLLSTAAAGAYRGNMQEPSALVVASNAASVFVSLVRNRALETRSVIGKVFHDLDGDGFQDSDEPGVGGIDVITADGELVTSDEFGKLSFNNLRPGRHAFRVDPMSLPEGLVARTTGPGARLQVLEVDGWSSPRLSFALDTREGGAATDVDAVVSDSTEVVDVVVEPLRTREERDADQANVFLNGPAIRLVAPLDGFVSATNRIYVGVRGEPMRPVALFRGDSLLVESTLLPNGVGDFVGVELAPGPQVLRVRSLNSWGRERWDSLAIHRSGPPARIDAQDRHLDLIADGRTAVTTRVRLFDAWGVPVVNEPYVTVRLDGGSVLGKDVDPSGLGHQLRAGPDGWLTVSVVGGRDSGESALVVETPDASVTIPVTFLPPVRPLFLTGVGQVSLGSAGDDFGAITAQGRIGDQTALTLSYDTRRLDQGRDVFGQSFDPLEEGRNPIMGDASVQRSLTPSRYQFSAKVERGLDWVMLGDVQTSGFSDGMELARYGRSLPGAAARVSTGGVVWNAFGASTTQALRQQQIRGSGSSGPFELGPGVLPGTEEVRLQVRALENTTRVLSEQILSRYEEYQIDYARGTVLLKQPVPSTDPSGNPVFLLISYEGEAGGDQNPVFGIRATGQLGGIAGEHVDSLPVSVSFVNDSQPGRSFRLGAISTGLVQESGLEVTAELALADGADSTDVASRIKGSSPLFDGRVEVSAEWTHVGDEFSNPANIALRPGTDEVRSSVQVEVGDGKLDVAHERQSFSARDLSRQRSTLGYTHQVLEDVQAEVRLAADASQSAGEDASSGAGEYKVTWSATSKLDVFAEGRNGLWSNGSGLANRGSYYGGGAAFRLAEELSVEARHLRVSPAGSSSPYDLTSVGLTSTLRAGTKAWGAYQITGGIDGRTNAAVVGLNHRFSIGSDWRFTTMIERRNGVGRATLGDPVLADPFQQPEENYTSGSFGTEYVPQGKPYRASLRAEKKNGNLSSTTLATLAGDVSFNASLALLSRQEFVERDMPGSQTTLYTRERSSLWGLAYRPTRSDELNVLLKFGWKDAINPFGSGVLASEGTESRLLGALEAIWAPRADFELGARYATRSTRVEPGLGIPAPLEIRDRTDFLGMRTRWFANEWIGLELEARGITSDRASGSVWDIAPGVVVRPLELLEVELGHRFGDLQDPDFAVRSGEGWYLTVGTRVTEDVLPTVAAFWRDRFGG